MLKKVFIGLVVVIALFCGVVAMQPADFKISRSAVIAATPADVFAQVNDFHRWENWSPWAKMDPTMKATYEGAPAGEGAVYSWIGNDQVGEGKMTMLKSQAPELVLIQLDFFKPMAATNMTEFTFKPDAQGTMVTWTMTGKNGFISKAFCLFMDMEKMVGPQFEQGLAQLKTIVETGRS